MGHKQIIVAAIAILVVLAEASVAYAQERYEFYTGVRSLGMGGAYTAVVNDETAILTNPTGLGKIREFSAMIIDPELHAGSNNAHVVKLDNLTKLFDPQNLLNELKNSKGSHFHAKAQVFPSFVTTNFGLGLHAKYSFDAQVNEAGTVYRLDYTNDYAGALGYCLRLFGGVIKIGSNARLINRVEVHRDLDPNSTNLKLNGIAREGLGLATDVGLTIAAPVQLLPTLSMVLRDVGNTSFTMGNGMFMNTAERPETVLQTLDVGVALFPILSNHSRATLTVDYHDALGAYKDEDVMKRLHVGGELNLGDLLFLRGGLNQRYWTAGLELSGANFQFQAASYGEEIGTGKTHREDRRFVTKIGFRF